MRVKKNLYQKFFFGILLTMSLAPSFYFSLCFLQKWNDYIHLDSKILAHIVDKEGVLKRRYVPQITYVFFVNNQKFLGKFFDEKHSFLNKSSAQQFLATIPNETMIWYSAQNPQKSSLIRIFPYAILVKAVLSIIIFLYFVFLGRYSRFFQPE